MNVENMTTRPMQYRSAGRATIASGAIGIIAVGFLTAFLTYRGESREVGTSMLRFHDIGVSLQFLFLVPAAFALYRLSQQQSRAMSRLTLNIGVGALLLTALFLLLIFPKVVSDGLYMFPQGVFGVWLIAINGRLKDLLSRKIRWFGMIVGLGLVLVGIFFVGYCIFVSTILLWIPAASIEEGQKIPHTPANIVLHYFIWIGSFLGVLTLPFWTILLGRRLLHEKS